MRQISKIILQLCVVAAIVLLFSGHFHLQARHEQLRTDFDGHWHYSPTTVPDFTFGKARIFEDETHRLIHSQDEQGNPITIQQELQVDPNAKLFRIGFTEGEVAAALAP